MRARRKIRCVSLARRRYAKDEQGATAIEFAIVAPVFLGLMFSIFEVGWFYFINASVDSAATDAARIIRTGQADGLSAGEFFNFFVCPKISIIGECSERLTVEVKKYDTFADLAADASAPFVCRDANQEDIDDISYDTSEELAIYRVRLCVIYDTLNPVIGMNLSENGLGQKKVTASYILRSEPYKTSSTSESD